MAIPINVLDGTAGLYVIYTFVCLFILYIVNLKLCLIAIFYVTYKVNFAFIMQLIWVNC